MRIFAVIHKSRPITGPRSFLTRPSSAGRAEVRRILHRSHLQAKLTVRAPDDAYEREADRVAEAVLRMPKPTASAAPAERLQRQCAACEEEELRRQAAPEPPEEKEEALGRQPEEKEEEEGEGEALQAQAAPGEVPEVTPDLETRIRALRGGGRPLRASVRSFFEPRFGRDFGAVRLHTGEAAAAVARAVRAQAFAVGRDIGFGAGKYRPESNQGRRLIAHELTHVVQQQAIDSARQTGTLQRLTDPMSDISTFQSPGPSGWWGAKFGCYRSNCSSARKHKGWDFHASVGTECRAVVAGTTTHHTENAGYGRYVKLTSGADSTKKYIYAHLSARESAGAVSEGDKIGEVGVTGTASSSRPHLHFTVKNGSTKVDPGGSFSEPTKVIEATGTTATTINKSAPEPCSPCPM